MHTLDINKTSKPSGSEYCVVRYVQVQIAWLTRAVNITSIQHRILYIKLDWLFLEMYYINFHHIKQSEINKGDDLNGFLGEVA